MLVKILLGIIINVLTVIAVIILILLTAAIVASYFALKPREYKGNRNPLIRPKGQALVAAHRSGARIAPENTLLAFQRCAENDDFGIDLFEFDLHMTQDGTLLVLHDDTLDRTTNACEHFGEKEIKPEGKSFDLLSKLNFGENYKDSSGNYPFKGLRAHEIPDNLKALSLEKVIDFLESKKKFRYSIDIKNCGEIGKKAADEFHRILKERNMLDRVILATFNQDITDYVDSKYSDFNRSASIREALRFYFACSFNLSVKAEKFKFEVLQIPANQYRIFRFGTKRLINYAHNHNIAVQYWTINKPKEIKRLNEIGADCIMSDVPNVAYKIIKGID